MLNKVSIHSKKTINTLKSNQNQVTISNIQIGGIFSENEYYLGYTDKMVLTDSTWKYFAQIPFRIRAGLANSQSSVPFKYEDESFFTSYDALYRIWIKRQSQRAVIDSHDISKQTLKKWEDSFVEHGAVGLLPELSFVDIDPRLEQLILLIKSSRPHKRASHALRLAEALQIPGSDLNLIRLAQRCHGYGQRMGQEDIEYFKGLQHILNSVAKQKTKKTNMHDAKQRPKTFFNFNRDHLQQRMELMKTLCQCQKQRQIRPVLTTFGISPNRFYVLKNRYMSYGIWGLVDLVQQGRTGEKISSELELQIIEHRLMDSSLSTTNMIKKLNLKCSKANVQKVYKRWGLSHFKKPIPIRGVLSIPVPVKVTHKSSNLKQSVKLQMPDLIAKARLKVNPSFSRFIKTLSYRKVSISNPGAIIAAPFLDQLGVVEALQAYGPCNFQPADITNNIIVNVLRIIAGFPTINDYTMNSDRSVAIASGLSLNPAKSRFYDSFESLRFEHLQALRNDASCRARELNIIEGKQIAIDYHCDPCDSRFPRDKALSKSPDKKGDLVYAHRPQIIWDTMTNTIINIAYCEGKSRAPSALYKFCENNLFKIIDTDVLEEIYADSEYTGEKQLVYLMVRSESDITMCLKQNPKIKKWKEETIRQEPWQNYEKKYRIASRDFILPETGKKFRFIVKQNKETLETRCFGNTHTDYTPVKILNSYHIRWPVETGIKDLIENYFLNKPTGTSPEKIEVHYYCVMLARLTIDYFRSILCCREWQTPEDWKCILSTIRTSMFSNQNCELSRHDSGDLLLTFLDGDRYGIKTELAKRMKQRKNAGLNKVSWWNGIGVRIAIKDQFKI
jgi:hypothetical protein